MSWIVMSMTRLLTCFQKSGNALRALSRLTGESKFFQRPRGMSVDRKTFLIKLLNRNSSKDFTLLDGIFDSTNVTRKTDHKRSESFGGICERQKSKSFDELLYKDEKSLKHTAVCKAISCIAPSRWSAFWDLFSLGLAFKPCCFLCKYILLLLLNLYVEYLMQLSKAKFKVLNIRKIQI